MVYSHIFVFIFILITEDEDDMGCDEWPHFRKEVVKGKDKRKEKVNRVRRDRAVNKVNNTAYFIWYCKSNGIKTK